MDSHGANRPQALALQYVSSVWFVVSHLCSTTQQLAAWVQTQNMKCTTKVDKSNKDRVYCVPKGPAKDRGPGRSFTNRRVTWMFKHRDDIIAKSVEMAKEKGLEIRPKSGFKQLWETALQNGDLLSQAISQAFCNEITIVFII